MATAKLESRALLAIDPKALGIAFMIPASRGNQRIGTREVVDIQGPLTSKDEGLFDSYESIKGRVQAACLSDASTVVLNINSPGGEVHLCFSTARDIRSMCAAAGKQLIAYIDGQGCSAAYALATSASAIMAAETSTVGSIGVITERQDVSEMLARDGIKISYITSGSKKAYGAPETPESEAERMDSQRTINNLAAMFFTLVEQHRGIPASHVAMLEAGTFIGQEAVNARLIDAVGTYESLFVESINAPTGVEASEPQPNEARVTFAQICEELAKMAGSEEESAKLAAAMLAALESTNKAEEPSEEKPADAPSEDKPSDAPAEEPKEEEEEAPAASADVATQAALATELETALAENKALKAQLDSDAKAKFFAQHSVSDTLKAVLESKPLADIEAIVAAMQVKPEIKKGLATVKTVTGNQTGDKSTRELRAVMGLEAKEPSQVSTSYSQVFNRKR